MPSHAYLLYSYCDLIHHIFWLSHLMRQTYVCLLVCVSLPHHHHFNDEGRSFLRWKRGEEKEEDDKAELNSQIISWWHTSSRMRDLLLHHYHLFLVSIYLCNPLVKTFMSICQLDCPILRLLIHSLLCCSFIHSFIHSFDCPISIHSHSSIQPAFAIF